MRVMKARNPIDRLIEAKEAKLASLDRAADKLKIELSALREARQAVADETPAANGKTQSSQSNEPRRRRSISGEWKAVLIDLAQKGNGGADLDQIADMCKRHGIELLRPTLRAQMSNYVKRGYLGRTGEGNFFIALAGLEVAGLHKASGESREEAGAPASTSAPVEG